MELLCKIGLHKWKFAKERFDTNYPNDKRTRVCIRCGLFRKYMMGWDCDWGGLPIHREVELIEEKYINPKSIKSWSVRNPNPLEEPCKQ